MQIAVIGKQGAGKHALAAQMHHDPSHPGAETHTPLLLSDLDSAEGLVQKARQEQGRLQNGKQTTGTGNAEPHLAQDVALTDPPWILPFIVVALHDEPFSTGSV